MKIVCHSSCRTSAILKYFCPLCVAIILALFILDTGIKQILWQTVKLQVKCQIKQHFMRVLTVCYDKNTGL